MDNNLLLKIERASRDRDFFILNKDNILKVYNFIDANLASYIDVCCNKFKTFSVNKTSYLYGSIITIAVSVVIACKW